MTACNTLETRLAQEPRTWLVTGVAGFIGANLLAATVNELHFPLGEGRGSSPAV